MRLPIKKIVIFFAAIFLSLVVVSKYFFINPAIRNLEKQTSLFLEDLVVDLNTWQLTKEKLSSTSQSFSNSRSYPFLIFNKRSEGEEMHGKVALRPYGGKYILLTVSLSIPFDDDKKLRDEQGLLDKHTLSEEAKRYIKDEKMIQELFDLSAYSPIGYLANVSPFWGDRPGDVDKFKEVERDERFGFDDYEGGRGRLNVWWDFPIESLPNNLKKSFEVFNSNVFNFGMNYINSFVINDKPRLGLNPIRFYIPVWILEGILYNSRVPTWPIWIIYGMFYFLFFKFLFKKTKDIKRRVLSIVVCYTLIQSITLLFVFFTMHLN